MNEGKGEDDRAADGVEPGMHWVQHVVEGRAGEKVTEGSDFVLFAQSFNRCMSWYLQKLETVSSQELLRYHTKPTFSIIEFILCGRFWIIAWYALHKAVFSKNMMCIGL